MVRPAARLSRTATLSKRETTSSRDVGRQVPAEGDVASVVLEAELQEWAEEQEAAAEQAGTRGELTLFLSTSDFVRRVEGGICSLMLLSFVNYARSATSPIPFPWYAAHFLGIGLGRGHHRADRGREERTVCSLAVILMGYMRVMSSQKKTPDSRRFVPGQKCQDASPSKSSATVITNLTHRTSLSRT